MNEARRVFVVDDEASVRWVVEKALSRAGIRTIPFEDARHALEALEAECPDVVITDLAMPHMDGHAFLAELQARAPGLPVVVISAHSDVDTVLRAYEGGAVEMLAKPFDIGELLALVLRLAAEQEPQASRPAPAAAPRMIGESAPMQAVYRIIGRLSRSSMTVLVTGESGSGKELVARTLHDHSPRRDKPFVAINTAAIPVELLESELFGHERGAFTGAQQRRIGRFEQAEGGTLFLDEIGDMPLDMQTRLLRVLSEHEFFRVGGHVPVRADVRIIAATHQDLEALVAAGRFREDLLHRLNVVRIRMPALRERREDIPALLEHFLRQAAAELGVEAKQLSRAAEARLVAYDWPGNVRELRNLCRRLTALAPSRQVGVEDLEAELVASAAAADAMSDWLENYFAAGEGVAQRASRDLEIALIRRALRETGGRRLEAAKLLGWGRNTLTRKIQEYGLEDQ